MQNTIVRGSRIQAVRSDIPLTLAPLALAIGMVLSGMARAETSGADAAVLEDVVVTATRRDTNLQNVGIAVSAFSGADLTNSGVTLSSDLASVTPGLQFAEPSGAPVAGLISIRGVSQNDFAGHIEPANAFYIDEVYQPSNASSVQEFYDVARVEVLKGPQGTLFGRNATGGLIHVITNQPGKSLDGYVDATFGSYGQKRFEGAVGGPISDTVSGRIAVMHDENDGFVKNSIGATLLKDDTYAARGQLKITPNDRLTINLSGDFYKIMPTTTGAAYITGATQNADGLGVPAPPGSPTGFGWVPSGDPFKGSFDYVGRFTRSMSSGAVHVSYDFGGITLSSITSYQHLKSEYSADNDFSPVPLAIFDQNANARHLTQELRLIGGSDALHWTAGAYFLRVDGTYGQAFQVLPFATTPQETHSVDTKSVSLFGQIDLPLRDDLRLTAGIRGTRDHKDYAYLENCVGPACGAFLAPNTIGTAGLLTDSHAESGWSGRLQLDWQLNADTLFYASINRGYKAFNYNAGFVGQAPLAKFRFDGENLMAYELGTKVEFLQRRARLNAAAFYYDYKNYQAFDQRGFNFTLFNTDAKIYGADLDFQVKATQGLTLKLGAAALHTEVSNVPIGNQLLTRKAPQSPSFTATVGATQSFTLGSWTLSGTFEDSYTGSNYSQLTNAPVTLMPSGWVANARINLSTLNDRLTFSVAANNVFDKRRPAYAFDVSGAPLGGTYNTYVKPRWISGSIRYAF
jgi:iron complex outermembrane recepter protein